MPVNASPPKLDGDADAAAQVGVVVVQYGASVLSPSLLSALRERVVGSAVIVRNPRGSAGDHEPVGDIGATLMVLDGNRGYSAAVNAGRAHGSIAHLPFHLVVTHDVELEPGCLENLARTLRNDATTAIAGPALVEASGGTARCGGTVRHLGLARHISRPWPFAGSGQNHDPEANEVDWIDGAVMMLRSSVVPSFDERYFLYGEDVAVCLAVRPRYRVVVVPNAVARQVSGASKRPGAHGYLIVRNALLLDRDRGIGRPSGALRSALMAGAQMKRVVTGPARRDSLRQLLGMAWGTVDGLRGVTGAPPKRLRRWGDVSVESSRSDRA